MPINLHDYVLAEWDDLYRALDSLQMFKFDYRRGVANIDLLAKTLGRWISWLEFDVRVSTKRVLHLAQQLDDLKEKLENRVTDWRSGFGREIKEILSKIDNLDMKIEDGADLISIQRRIESLDRKHHIFDALLLGDLYMPPFTVSRRDWQHARAIISNYDEGLAEELDRDMQHFIR